jgi:D-alanyl-D-alanine carboxypeptidase
MADEFSAPRLVAIATAIFFVTGCSTGSVQPGVKLATTPPPAAVLENLPITSPIPLESTIKFALSSLIKSPELGDHVGVSVGDVLTGTMIYQSDSASPNDQFIPASTIKLFTTTAVLNVNKPDAQVTFKGKIVSLSDLVETTLTESDNTGASILSKLLPVSIELALANSLPALDLSQTTVVDGSGLSRKNRTTPSTLVHLLMLIADPQRAELAHILSGLPISGVDGTLKNRAEAVPGQIRAKTGTLTGVDVLAGYVVDSAKRALAFAVMVDRAPKTGPARKKIDSIVTALVRLS